MTNQTSPAETQPAKTQPPEIQPLNPTSFSARPQTIPEKPKKKLLAFWLLVLVNLIVFNAIYNFAVAEKGTPILKSLMTNSVLDLWGLKYKLFPSTGLQLDGIVFYSEKTPSAIINGEVVYEGETIAGTKIIKINRNSVSFQKGFRTWTQEVEPRH